MSHTITGVVLQARRVLDDPFLLLSLLLFLLLYTLSRNINLYPFDSLLRPGTAGTNGEIFESPTACWRLAFATSDISSDRPPLSR